MIRIGQEDGPDVLPVVQRGNRRPFHRVLELRKCVDSRHQLVGTTPAIRSPPKEKRDPLVRGYFSRRDVGLLSARDACLCHWVVQTVRVVRCRLTPEVS